MSQLSKLEFPDKMKHLKKYLLRAIELEEKDPAISFQVMMFILMSVNADSNLKNDKDVKNILNVSLSILEKLKNSISKENKELNYFENFVTLSFVAAEKENDRITLMFQSHEDDPSFISQNLDAIKQLAIKFSNTSS